MVPSGSTTWKFTMGRCTAVWPELLPADCLDTLGFLSSVSYEGHSDHQLNTLDSYRACKFVFGAMKGDINQMCFSCQVKHEKEMSYGPACSADLGSSFYMEFPSLCVSSSCHFSSATRGCIRGSLAMLTVLLCVNIYVMFEMTFQKSWSLPRHPSQVSAWSLIRRSPSSAPLKAGRLQPSDGLKQVWFSLMTQNPEHKRPS